MGAGAQRAAANEARFRAANEEIEAKVLQLDLREQPTPYLCECDDRDCVEVVRLTADEYEQVRSAPKRFVVAPNHKDVDARVLDEHNGFVVIEKTGEEGRLVEESDPRR